MKGIPYSTVVIWPGLIGSGSEPAEAQTHLAHRGAKRKHTDMSLLTQNNRIGVPSPAEALLSDADHRLPVGQQRKAPRRWLDRR